MLFDGLCLAALALAGMVGVLAGLLVARRWLRPPSAPRFVPLDSDVEDAIQASATAWAETRGRPTAAPLVADKLRLAYRLGRYDDPDRRPGRWLP